jgi:hypothetical protein
MWCREIPVVVLIYCDPKILTERHLDLEVLSLVGCKNGGGDVFGLAPLQPRCVAKICKVSVSDI